MIILNLHHIYYKDLSILQRNLCCIWNLHLVTSLIFAIFKNYDLNFLLIFLFWWCRNLNFVYTSLFKTSHFFLKKMWCFEIVFFYTSKSYNVSYLYITKHSLNHGFYTIIVTITDRKQNGAITYHKLSAFKDLFAVKKCTGVSGTAAEEWYLIDECSAKESEYPTFTKT